MADQKRMVWIVGSVVLLMAGVFLVPKLLKKYTGKLYKNSHKDIDFDDFGPEIVIKHTKEVKESGN